MRKLLFIFVLLALSIPCSAATIVVDPNGSADYTTIQAAINAASNGDTVSVAGGTYNENISSASEITIHFTGTATINGQVTTGIGTDIIADADLTINSAGDITLGGNITVGGKLAVYTEGGGIYITGSIHIQASEVILSTVGNININDPATVNGSISVSIYAGIDIAGSGNVTGGSVIIATGGIAMPIIVAGTIYVDKDAPGSGNGSSWDDAFTELQSALDVAWPGNEIRVAEGTYLPTSDYGLGIGSRGRHFRMRNHIAIYGGFAGYGTADPNNRDVELYETILSGDLNCDDGPDFVNNDENSYHVVTGSNTNETAILDGFTIRDGNANQRWPSPHSCGGGIYNYSSSLTIIDCQIVENKASEAGGGIYCEDSSPELSNCTISENSADYYGGGIHCGFNYRSKPTILSCNISKNSATIGGGVTFSDGLFSNCTITGNMAIEGGGLMGCSGTITSCYITRNTGMMGGGLKHCDGVISNCIISANNVGGGLFACNGLIVNCTIIGNSSNAMRGGGLFACRGSITNCIIWSNRAKGGHLSQYASCSTPVSSCVQEGCDEGVCISSDPCFIQPGYWDEDIWVDGDYHLQPTSPCIDTGDNSVVEPNSTDLDGNERIINGIVDMGAYEALGPIEADVHIVPRVINRNNRMKRVMAIMRLPAGIGKGDVVRESFELYAGELDGEPVGAILERVIGRGNMTRVFVLFDKDEVMNAVGDVEMVDLTVVGRLESGQYIQGSDTVRIVKPRRRRPHWQAGKRRRWKR